MRKEVGVAALAALLFAGCGDAETTDVRGYTKAPLEVPGLRIDSEARSEMNRLGTPDRPRGEPIAPRADTTATN